MSTLHDDLARLTASQPAQPGDRTAAVTRKARRMRRTRSVAAGAAVLALALPVAALAQHHEPPSRFTTTPVTSWPDRSQPEDRGVADGALTSYRTLTTGLGEDVGQDVRWLYRGTIALPDHDDTYVAVFLTHHDGREVVVVAHTRRTQVDARGVDVDGPGSLDKSSSPWVSQEVPATKSLSHVGAYLEYGSAQYRDVLFVLADPATAEAAAEVTPIPHADLGASARAAVPARLVARHGVIVQDVGVLTGPVTVTLRDARGHVGPTGPLSATSTPGLVQPVALTVPPGFTSNSSTTGQTERQQDGSYGETSAFEYAVTLPATAKVAVLARCYGGGTMSFSLERDGADETPVARGTAPCDGNQYQPLVHALGANNGYLVRTSSSNKLLAYTYEAGTVR